MAEYIKTLKEDNGDITYPVTQAGAVLLSGGGDLETTLNAKASQTAVNGKIDIGDVQSTDIVSNAVTTAKIADESVTAAKLAPGIVTMQRTVLFTSSGTAANITVSQALNNFDEVEFWYKDTNSTPNQMIRLIPGTSLKVICDIAHVGGSNTVYWNLASWNWTAGSTTLSYGSNHYQKNLMASSISTSSSTAIQITKIVGIKFVSN